MGSACSRVTKLSIINCQLSTDTDGKTARQFVCQVLSTRESHALNRTEYYRGCLSRCRIGDGDLSARMAVRRDLCDLARRTRRLFDPGNAHDSKDRGRTRPVADRLGISVA